MQFQSAALTSRLASIMFVIVVCASILITSAASATTYYVNEATGNDGYSGVRSTSPWKTISRGDISNALNPGDTVIVAAGTYPQSTSDGVKLANRSGAPGSPITYKASGRVIIDQSGYLGSSVGFRLMSGMHHIVIDGFEITGAQWGVYFDGVDVASGCHDNTVKNCIIHDLHYATPSGGVWDSWCAGIYNSASSNNTINNNIIYNVGTPGLDAWPSTSLWAACIMSPVGQGIKIYNNTLVNAWAGIHAWEVGSSTVRNNIIADMWKFGISNSQGPGSILNSNNLFFSTVAGYTDYVGNISNGTGEFDADPQFVNDLAHDYQLMPGSPAINAGVDVGLGFIGFAPDLGALESNYNASTTFETDNIADLRTQANGTPIRLTSAKVVTAASTTFSDGTYYIEEPTRACGIKIVPSTGVLAVALWDRVTLEGVLSVDPNGERVIIVTAITSKVSGTKLGPLGMKCREVPTPTGPDTSGLLARICGWVTYKAFDGSYMYIDDASGTKDATGNKGTRVVLSGLTTPLANPPAADQFVSVTGIVGAVQDGVKLVRVLKTRSDSDVTIVPVSLTEDQMAKRWIGSNFGSDTQRRPFSFIYGGQNSSAILSGWTFSSSVAAIDANRSLRTLTYTDPVSGLQLRCVSTEYSDYPAVEWTLYFKNTGTADTPILESVKALDADMYGGSGTYNLYYADGSAMVITDFQPRQTALSSGSPVHLAPFGGRSSGGSNDNIYMGVLPFFNLAKPDGSGVTIGVGWTGQWAADFNRNTNTTVNVQAGMEITHLKLHPGEEIRTPAVLMMFWKGANRTYGQNRLRQLLFAHYSPTVAGGAPADPPVCGAYAQAQPELFTADQHIQSINLMSSHGVPAKYYWIDAGWFVCPNNNWALGVGNFDPDLARYPGGLKPIADAAHSKGWGFSLWFEPERVMPNTWVYNNHPEWIITPPSNLPASIMYMYNDHFNLFDLSNPAALAWLKSKVSGMITSVGIDQYRNDFNMYPLYYWRKGEASDRQGMKEIQYITALYDYFDTLKRDHPNLLFDDCASGGRRIDFEMLRRCYVLTRTDYLWDPTGQQAMTYGLSQWIPQTGIGSDTQDTYKCRSGYGSHFIFSCDWISNATNTAMFTLWAQNVGNENGIKYLFCGDFYPMGSYSTANNVWVAWQYDRPDLGEGILQVFRRGGSTSASNIYTLKALIPTATYQVTYVDNPGSPLTKTGTQLMQSGLSFSLTNAPSATYVTYKRIL